MQTEEHFDKITSESMERGLDLNYDQTECVVTTEKSIIEISHLKSKGEDIKQVNIFESLVYTLEANGKCLIGLKGEKLLRTHSAT